MSEWETENVLNSQNQHATQLPLQPIFARQEFIINYLIHPFPTKDLQNTIQTWLGDSDNREGLFTKFDTQPVDFNEADSASFKEIVQELSDHDSSHLQIFWNRQFQEKILFILDSWSVFSSEYSQLLQQFLNVVQKKLGPNKIYGNCYPGLLVLAGKIKQKLGRKGVKFQANLNQIKGQGIKGQEIKGQGIKGQGIKAQGIKGQGIKGQGIKGQGIKGQGIKGQESKEDIFFGHYVDEQQAKAKKSGTYLVKIQNQQKQSLGSYIAEQKLYQKNEQTWKRFFFIGTTLKRYNIDSATELEIQNQCRKVYLFTDLLLSNNELTQPSKRICCSRFFYANFDICPLEKGNLICKGQINPLRNRVNRLYQKEANQSKEQSRLFDQCMEELMLDICSLLNRGGGVVLVFAKKNYLQTWAEGDFIIEQKKQIYLTLLKQWLQCIKPRVQIGNQIKITFVPIVKHPYQYDYLTQVQTESERAANRNYVQGRYCLRIVVVPSQAQKLYYYSRNEEVLSAVYEDGETVLLRGERIWREMNRKFEYFYAGDVDEETQELLGRDYLCIERHECLQPYPGLPLHFEQQRKEAQSSKEFKYMSMIVAHKSNHADIQRKIANRGIECHLPDTYQNLGLRSSSSSTSIYHNIRFDQLFSEIVYNKEFQYHGKSILLIAITSYIKLQSRTEKDLYPKVNLISHLDAIKKVFPDSRESVQLFSFVSDQGELQQYIRAYKRESTLLVYYRLHDAGQKCIFKNPKNLDKILEAERSARWRLIYSVGASTK